MDTIAEIRRLHFVENKKISELAKRFKLSRPTIRKHLKTFQVGLFLQVLLQCLVLLPVQLAFRATIFRLELFFLRPIL